MQENIQSFFEEHLEKIQEFFNSVGLSEVDEGEIGNFIQYLVDKVFGIKTSWEKISSVDMGPAGNIDTYMLAWIEKKKLCKILFTYNLNGNYSLAD